MTSEPNEPAPKSSPNPSVAPPSAMRPWLIRIGVALGVVLVGLVIAAPWIAESDRVRNYVVSSLNESLEGTFRAGRISTSWFGPTEVWNVAVSDPDGREVLSVEHAKISRGLWGLARSWQDLGDAEVKNARLTFQAGADGSLGFVRAFSPREAAPPSTAPYPAMRVKAALSGVSVKVVSADNAAYELTDIHGSAEMDTLSRYKADLTALTVGGAKIHVTADASGLLHKKEFLLFESKSHVAVTADGPVEAGPIFALLGVPGTQGKLRVDRLEAKIESHSADVRCIISVSQLRPAKSDVPAHPIDFQLSSILSGNVGDANGLCTGTVTLSGDPGKFDARVIYRRSPVPLDFSAAGLAEAFVSGDTRGLPDVLVEADGYLDLGAIGQAAPAFLGLQPDVTLSSGRLDVRKFQFFTREKISADGSNVEPPSADGAVEFKDLVATKSGAPVRIEPATFTFAMKIRPVKGLEVQRAELTSPFASVAAAGTREAFAAKFSFDLNRLYPPLRQVFDLGDFALAGTVSGELAAVRPNDGEIRVDRLSADAKSFLFKRGDRKLPIDAASIRTQGVIRLDKNRPVRWEVADASFDLDCSTVGRIAGWADVKTGGFHADVTLKRADLVGVVGKLKGLKFDVAPLARWGGRLEVPDLALDRKDDNSSFAATGTVTARDLTLDGGPIGVSEATVRVEQAVLGAGFDNLTVAVASVKSGIVAANVSDVRLAWGKQFTASGRGRVVAQLGAVLPIVARVSKSKAVPDLSGALDWTADEARVGPQEVALKSHGTIDDAALRTGERTERAPRIRFGEAARVVFKDGQFARIEVDCATFDAPGRLVGSAAGWAERAGAFQARTDFSAADLAFADAWLKAFGVEALGPYAGILSVTATASRGADGRILSDGSATAKNIRVDGRALGIEPVKLTWKGAALAAAYDSLSFKSAEVVSPAASATGSGVSAKWGKELGLSGELSVDADAGATLAALHALTNREMPGVTGKVKWAGTAKLAPARADGVSAFTLAGAGELQNAKVSVAGAPRDVGTGTFSETAELAFKGSDPVSLNVSKAALQFPGKLVGSATASYDFAKGGFDATVDVAQADVATAADWTAAFGVTILKRYAGTAKVAGSASCKSSKDPILSTGKAVVNDVRVDGKPLPNIPDVSVEWQKASLNLAAATKDFAADRIILITGPVSAQGDGLSGALGGAVRAKGKLVLTAELASAQPALMQLLEIQKLQPLDGKLLYTGTLSSDEKTTTLDGKLVITNLRVGTGATAFADPQVTLTTTASVDPAKATVTLAALSLQSSCVTLTAKGAIHQYKTDRSVDLTGDYAGTWEKILPVACQFYPGLKGLVSLTGNTGGPFALKGSLNSVSTTPPYLRPGLEGSAQLGWSTAQVTVLDYAFKFGPATLAATLKDGKVTLPPTPVATIPPENGKLRLAGTLDLSQPTPVLSIAGKQALVEGLKIDREFSAKMLNRFNPLFGGDAAGRATVSVQDLVLPLGEAEATKSMSGAGRVDLTELRVNAQGFFAEILQLLEIVPKGEFDVPATGADFTFKGGRITYRDFRVQVNPTTDLIFSGSAGLFDDKVDLVVSLPGGPAVLERMGLPKSLAASFGERRIEIPIKGTRSHPTLDVADFIRRATVGRFGDLFK